MWWHLFYRYVKTPRYISGRSSLQRLSIAAYLSKHTSSIKRKVWTTGTHRWRNLLVSAKLLSLCPILQPPFDTFFHEWSFIIPASVLCELHMIWIWVTVRIVFMIHWTTWPKQSKGPAGEDEYWENHLLQVCVLTDATLAFAIRCYSLTTIMSITWYFDVSTQQTPNPRLWTMKSVPCSQDRTVIKRCINSADVFPCEHLLRYLTQCFCACHFGTLTQPTHSCRCLQNQSSVLVLV